LTVEFPICIVEVVRFTFAPTFTAVVKFPMEKLAFVSVTVLRVRDPVEIDDEFTGVLTVVLPIWNPEVVKFTFAPTLAPVMVLRVPVERTEELACVLTVEFPICKVLVVRFTLAPTFAPVVKLPVLKLPVPDVVRVVKIRDPVEIALEFI
jgi:hypothetical protein